MVVFTVLLLNSIVNAGGNNLPINSKPLICHQMEMHKKVQDYDPPMNTYFVYKDYFIQPHNRADYDTSYIIKKKNLLFNKITLKDVSGLFYTNTILCEDSKNNQFIVLEDEWEGEDASSGTGILVIDISNNTAKKLYRDNFDDERYTPKKLLNQQKYLPITPTLFEKDGGLYMKVGSTYKFDIVTLKKPANVK